MSKPVARLAALRTLLDDPARRRAMGEAALRRVREEFGAELMACRTLELYREIVSARRPGGQALATSPAAGL